MAKLPFIEENVSAQAARLGGANLGSTAVSGAISKGVSEARNLGEFILKKRDADRRMEEEESNLSFFRKDAEVFQGMVNAVQNGKELEELEAKYRSGIEDRYKKHALEDLGLEEGSDRYERMRERYSRRQGATMDTVVLGEISKKNAAFWLEKASDLENGQASLVLDKPEMFSALLDEGAPYDLDTAPPGVDRQKQQEAVKAHYSKLGLISGAELVDRATTAADLADLKTQIMDKDGIYRPNMSSEHLIRLENAIDTKMGGLEAKEEREFNTYLSVRPHGGKARPEWAREQARKHGRENELRIVEQVASDVEAAKLGGPKSWRPLREKYQALFEAADTKDAPQALKALNLVQATTDGLDRQLRAQPYEFSVTNNPALKEKSDRANELLNDEDTENNGTGFNLLKELYLEADAYQKEIGLSISERRIVGKSNPIIDVMRHAIVDGPKAVINVVAAFEEVYKDDFERAMSEIGDDIPPGFMPVLMAESPSDRDLAASNINTSTKDIAEIASVNLGVPPTDIRKNIFTAINSDLANIAASHGFELNGPGRGLRNIKMIERHALTYLASGQEDSEAKAGKRAVEAFFSGTAYVRLRNGDAVRISTKDPSVSPDNVEKGLNLIARDPSLLGSDLLPLGPDLEGVGDAEHKRLDRVKKQQSFRAHPTTDGKAYQFYADEDGATPLTVGGVEIRMTPAELQELAMSVGNVALGATPDAPAVAAQGSQR